MSIETRLSQVGQEHLLKYKSELTSEQWTAFEAQLSDVNWEAAPKWIEEYVVNRPSCELPSDLSPAQYYTVKPETAEQEALYAEAEAKGAELIAGGKVALCTVAGGQGTRLGFDGPKGTYPTSIIKNKSLFQLFAEQVLGLQKRFNVKLKWYLMTSYINNEATVAFFEENNYFGLEADQVKFFVQGLMPVFGQDGKVLLDAKDAMAMSPDGHGGTLIALEKSGALAEMKANGVEHISYFQVDNPLVSVIDPLFVGLHHLTGSDMSSRSLTKTGPFEKLGNFCIADGQMTIIEYSDMPDELATAEDESGRLLYRAGSPAIHVIRRDFVESLTSGELKLPFHRADKKVPFLNEAGEQVKPEENNAVKLETFIFDALPMAKNPLILEACREDQFGPVKNATGVDSAESCRELMQDKCARWLEAAGVAVPRKADGTLDCQLEIASNFASDAAELAEKDGLTAPEAGASVYYG